MNFTCVAKNNYFITRNYVYQRHSIDRKSVFNIKILILHIVCLFTAQLVSNIYFTIFIQANINPRSLFMFSLKNLHIDC